MKKAAISLFLGLWVVSAFAQTKAPDYAFKVLISSGDNTIIKNNKWENLKIGTPLGKNDQVRVEGFLGLQHASGKTLEIKTAGTYKVSDLLARVPAGSTSIGERYANFVVKRMTGGGGSNGTNQNATGASERGIFLFAMMPYKKEGGFFVMGDKLPFRWFADPDKKTKTYEVMVKDFCGSTLFQDVTKDTNYVLNLKNPKLIVKDETCSQLNLFVHSKENHTYRDMSDTPYNFQILDEKTAKAIQREFASLLPPDKEMTAMDCIIAGAFYEDKKLYVNALEYYDKAVKLEPGVEDFKKVRQQFIDDNQIGKLKPTSYDKKNK